MSQVEQLRQMLNGVNGQVKTLEGLKNIAHSKLDKESLSKLQPLTAELTKAINSAKTGDSEGLNKFIQAHANSNK